MIVVTVSNTTNSTWSWRELQGVFQEHEEIWIAAHTKERLEKTEGSAKEEKVALHLPVLKFSEEGSEKALEEAEIVQQKTREAGFQRIAENEGQ